MKKQLRTRPAAKAIAVILAVVTLAAGTLSTLFTLAQWDSAWGGGNYYTSASYYNTLYDSSVRVREMATLLQNRAWDGKLSYLEEQELEIFRKMLEPENTNFRVRLVDNVTGELIYTNLPGDTSKSALEQAVRQISYTPLTLSRNRELAERDYVQWESGGDGGQVQKVYVHFPDGELAAYAPEDSEAAGPYGWRYYPENEDWRYDRAADSRVLSVSLALEYGVADPMRVEDEFMEGYRGYRVYSRYLPALAVAALVLDGVFLALFVFLCLGAGRRPDREGAVLNWFDRIPLDVLAVAEFFVLLGVIGLADSVIDTVNWADVMPPSADLVAGIAALALVGAGSVLACLLTVVTRIKTRTLWKNILVLRLCRWLLRYLGRGCRALGRGVKEATHTLSVSVRAAALFGVYLLANAILAGGFFNSYGGGFYLLGLLVVNGGTVWMICRWTQQWRTIRESTGRIVGGETNVQIDTTKMYRDLKEHAGQLNDLGLAIDHAVDERLKSEHFKAELITNVSHDLKTPLTSIINYVDLLKKEDIRDPKVLEYLEVLDRKSQRLKKLTEDLVEASKASTGNVTVNADRMDLVQFTQQAAAEYEDRLADRQLTLVSKMPDGPVYIRADGRHMWRILDNLLSNCVKYALEGTRVYLEVTAWEGRAGISLKNISREALDISPEELTERFVRGDESRTTEGSGLGLSIARSLTEVQGGLFRLDIDADLFKATALFPQEFLPEEEK